ncbi:MAG: PH domain-containing protein [Bacteroidia bacterium]
MNNPFPQSTRQSPAALIFFAIRVVMGIVRQWWPLVLIVLFRSGQEGSGRKVYMGLGLAALGIFLIIRSALGYFRFTFNLTEESLEVQKGLFSRQKLSIPFERIQAVNFEQDIIHQLLNVVKVNIDTAGSGGAEVSFAALTRPDAEAMRRFILENRKEVVGEEVEEEEAAALAEQAQTRPWLRLSLDDLLKVGLGQNHLRTALIIIGFFFSILNRVEEAMGWDAEDVYYSIVGMELNLENWVSIGLIILPFFLIISIIFSLVRTFLRYFDLRVMRTARGYRLTAGLLQRREQEVNLGKVQMARGKRTWLERLLKQHTFSLKQASSKAGGGGNFVVPGLTDANVEKLLQPLYGDELEFEKDRFGPSNWYRYRLFLFRALFPALLFASSYFYTQNLQVFILAGLWLVIGTWWSYRFVKTFSINVNQEILEVQRGVFTRSQDLLAIYKVQAVTMRQSPYQRRHALASLTLHTAGGDLSLPYIDMVRAQVLRDFFLYKVETDSRDWM